MKLSGLAARRIAGVLMLPLGWAGVLIAQSELKSPPDIPPEIVAQYEHLGAKYGHFKTFDIRFHALSFHTRFTAAPIAAAEQRSDHSTSLSLDEVLAYKSKEHIVQAEDASEVLPGFRHLVALAAAEETKLPKIDQPFGIFLGVQPGWATKDMFDSMARLDRINQSNRLWLVDLSEWTLLTQESFQQLARQKSLRGLILNATNTNDTFLQQLTKLPELRLLEMNGCVDSYRRYATQRESESAYSSILTSAGIGALVKLPHLQKLSMAHCDLTDSALTNLSEIQQLEILNLARNELLTDASLSEVFKLKNLQQLDLAGCTKLTDTGFRNVRNLQELRVLNVSRTNFGDQALKEIGGLEKLELLSLARCQRMSGEGLRSLTGLRQLKELDLSDTKFSEADMKMIASMAQLRTLHLSWCRGVGPGFKGLSTLKQLRELAVAGTEIDDAGLAALAEMPELEALDLAQCAKLSDAGLKALSRLPKLKRLRIDHCKGITDVGCKYLAAISTLEFLAANGCAVTDTGIRELRQLPNLKTLELDLTDVTASAFSDPTGFKELRLLSAWYSRSIKVDQVAKFLPNCRIIDVESATAPFKPQAKPDTSESLKSPRPRSRFRVWAALALFALWVVTLLIIAIRRRKSSTKVSQ
jgi:Leucine-rich repeat (LRR) protein